MITLHIMIVDGEAQVHIANPQSSPRRTPTGE